MQLLKVALIK